MQPLGIILGPQEHLQGLWPSPFIQLSPLLATHSHGSSPHVGNLGVVSQHCQHVRAQCSFMHCKWPVLHVLDHPKHLLDWHVNPVTVCKDSMFTVSSKNR